MVDATLPDRAPGSYVPYGKKPYYLPEPLPPEMEVEVDPGLRETLESSCRGRATTGR